MRSLLKKIFSPRVLAVNGYRYGLAICVGILTAMLFMIMMVLCFKAYNLFI